MGGGSNEKTRGRGKKSEKIRVDVNWDLRTEVDG